MLSGVLATPSVFALWRGRMVSGKLRVGVGIVAAWGISRDEFVYEGCDRTLEDGRPCTLGPSKRAGRNGPWSPNSRSRQGHQCAPTGQGKKMFFFYVQFDDTEVVKVFEKGGHDLLGMSGEEFDSRFHNNQEDQRKFLQQVMGKTWTVKLGEEEQGRQVDSFRTALSFNEVVVNSSRAVEDALSTQMDSLGIAREADGDEELAASIAEQFWEDQQAEEFHRLKQAEEARYG